MSERRIAKRLAKWEHAKERLLEFVQQGDEERAKFLLHEMILLREYWDRPDVTKEQAVAAYYADHN